MQADRGHPIMSKAQACMHPYGKAMIATIACKRCMTVQGVYSIAQGWQCSRKDCAGVSSKT